MARRSAAVNGGPSSPPGRNFAAEPLRAPSNERICFWTRLARARRGPSPLGDRCDAFRHVRVCFFSHVWRACFVGFFFFGVEREVRVHKRNARKSSIVQGARKHNPVTVAPLILSCSIARRHQVRSGQVDGTLEETYTTSTCTHHPHPLTVRTLCILEPCLEIVSSSDRIVVVHRSPIAFSNVRASPPQPVVRASCDLPRRVALLTRARELRPPRGAGHRETRRGGRAGTKHVRHCRHSPRTNVSSTRGTSCVRSPAWSLGDRRR